jgi:hypothetical protein
VKVVGFSAGAIGHEGNTDRMVKAILEQSEQDTEFFKLTELDYSACKGCVQLCAKPQLCMIEDDLFSILPKVKEADAVVLGSPARHSSVSATMLSFIDRFWAYRHVSIAIRGKPFVLVLSHLFPWTADGAAADFRKALKTYRVNVIDVVTYCSNSPPCFTCGRHHECRIGGLYRLRGEDGMSLDITPDLFGKWEDHPETVTKIAAAANKLKNLQGGSTVVKGQPHCAKA